MKEVPVKTRAGKCFIVRGSIGVGLGSLRRAAQVRDLCAASELPVQLAQADWDAVEAERILTYRPAAPPGP
jgi:hypothetical protein